MMQIAHFLQKDKLFCEKSIEIYAESRGPDPHSLNTNELLSRQPLFLTGLLSKIEGVGLSIEDSLI